jgi:hypothetical protein
MGGGCPSCGRRLAQGAPVANLWALGAPRAGGDWRRVPLWRTYGRWVPLVRAAIGAGCPSSKKRERLPSSGVSIRA